MAVRCFSCRQLYDNYVDHDKHDTCDAGAYSVTLDEDTIRSLALDHAKHYGADETIQYLQERLRDAHSDAERNHLLDALSWVRRRHSEPHAVADGGHIGIGGP